MRLLAIAVAVCVGGGVPRDALAQVTLTPAGVLTDVQQSYATVTEYTAVFRHTTTVTSANQQSVITRDGHVYASSSGSFRYDYVRKLRGRVKLTNHVIFDGVSVWEIDHTARTFRQQALRHSNADALAFVTATANLGVGYTVALSTTSGFGSGTDVVLELTPGQPALPTLYYVVAASPWRVKQAVIVDPSGVIERFWFFSPDTTKPVPAWSFQVSRRAVASYTLVP